MEYIFFTFHIYRLLIDDQYTILVKISLKRKSDKIKRVLVKYSKLWFIQALHLEKKGNWEDDQYSSLHLQYTAKQNPNTTILKTIERD